MVSHVLCIWSIWLLLRSAAEFPSGWCGSCVAKICIRLWRMVHLCLIAFVGRVQLQDFWGYWELWSGPENNSSNPLFVLSWCSLTLGWVYGVPIRWVRFLVFLFFCFCFCFWCSLCATCAKFCPLFCWEPFDKFLLFAHKKRWLMQFTCLSVVSRICQLAFNGKNSWLLITV